MTHGGIVSFVWDVANLIRNTFRRGHYQNVILPLTVLRRLNCVLAETKRAVLEIEASSLVSKAEAGKFHPFHQQAKSRAGVSELEGY